MRPPRCRRTISGSRDRTTLPRTVRSTLNTISGRGRVRRSSSLHPRGVGLELLAVLGEQREPDAIARHEPRDPRGERLEGERHVDRARDDVEHRVLRLELLDLAERRLVRVLLLRQPLRHGGDPPGRDGQRRTAGSPTRSSSGTKTSGWSGMPPASAQAIGCAAPKRDQHPDGPDGARSSRAAHGGVRTDPASGCTPPARGAADDRTTAAGGDRRDRARAACAASILYTPRAPSPCRPRCRRSVVRAGLLETDPLVPAVHAADRDRAGPGTSGSGGRRSRSTRCARCRDRCSRTAARRAPASST